MLVQIDSATLEQLRAVARDEQTTLGEIIRRAIDDHLGKEPEGHL